ncbi:hypothetical protein KUTeg_005461 [Tegillarca granosa]|uniref:Shootin-1 n=1 Tax=Tegillarca granosa TaxID=220873 RepID=A0ABQ9FJR3_TEGGR|nr:hypothetical protein KUTeg_005461 [Tegillarca granosa]
MFIFFIFVVVVIQYEDLLQKYEENEKKYEDLVTKYKEKEKQLQEMQKLIQPAVSEYEEMKMKYDMEVDMRTEAENFASQYTVTCTKLHMTEQSLTQYKEAIEELSKVSETAYKEFEILEAKFVLAQKRNSDVQDEMSKIKIQNEAIKKQSTILMSNAANNMQLVMALNEVESLTTQLKEEKQKYEKEICELKQQLEECSGTAAMEEMNNENSRLKEEKNKLDEKISQFEEEYKTLEAQCMLS